MPKLSLAKLERHLYSAADRLRQEGLDAATYKDYIFGMLFLKRCSDVFEAEHDRIVGRKVEEGMVRDEAEARYGENPDYYDGFFVPERARWRYLQSRLGDATEPYGKVLDKALGALSEHNESLEHVLDHIQLADTLLHPMHREGGELERFDRVIANPPFSQNYTRSGMEFPERFRWGWCPTSGKKGDLMFAQHMLAVCKPGGMVATVMPHGVLFRGGAEKEIRRKWLEQDLLEAVIGLPPNLFYGTGIPACILVLRPNLTGQSLNPHKPAERRGQALFVNADAEFHAGRARNYLRPEHIEKIVSTFDRFEDVPGYARCVVLAEIGGSANDWNLNIRRYVDNSPPPEPHDVRAHLLGGVPVAEVAAKRALFEALGFAVVHAFVPPSPGGRGAEGEGAYFDFAPALADRAAIRPLVEYDPGVQARIEARRAALAAWWTAHAPRLADLPEHRQLNRVRAEFLDTFGAALLPLGTLDRFKLAGVIATWWTETLPDFKTLLENGFPGVIDGWVDAIADAVEDDEAAGPAFDPFGHKLVRRVMADYLERIAAAKADIARFKGEKEAFEQGNPPDDADEEELANWNQARDLERQMKELKAENREALKELAKLEKASAKTRAGLFDEQDAVVVAKARLLPVLDRLAAIEAELAPYEDIKKQLTEARARYRELTAAFVDVLKFRCDALSEDEKRDLVLELFAQDVRTGLDAAVNEKRQELVRFVEGVWDKYRVTLVDLRQDRAAIEAKLSKCLQRMGYL